MARKATHVMKVTPRDDDTAFDQMLNGTGFSIYGRADKKAKERAAKEQGREVTFRKLKQNER